MNYTSDFLCYAVVISLFLLTGVLSVLVGIPLVLSGENSFVRVGVGLLVSGTIQAILAAVVGRY